MKIFWLSCLVGLNSAKSHDEIKEDFKKLDTTINPALSRLLLDIYEKSKVDFEHNKEIHLALLSDVLHLRRLTLENENRSKNTIEEVKLLNNQLKTMEDRHKHTETELRADVREAKKGNKLAVTLICVACGSIIIFFGTCFYKLFYS
ncbi:hypothetical protein [Alphaproteobacteria bacterium endosymbiont of Tiliacea citrago]|uniref:hypothetical protein n=1 Tax=Alphaproteobacteria bacterium endosymbiont of Tiliacea citrago TaxID=3077944 RepID=UPI00313DE91F